MVHLDSNTSITAPTLKSPFALSVDTNWTQSSFSRIALICFPLTSAVWVHFQFAYPPTQNRVNSKEPAWLSKMSSLPQFNPSESPNYGYTVPPMPSPNLRAFLEYIDAQSTWDLDRILNCFDDALEHRILPLSLGRPVLNKRQYGEYMRGVRPLFKSPFDLTLHEVIEADNAIISHLSSKCETVSGRPYANEYIIITHFVPPPPSASPSTLPKIRLVKEYVDSSYSKKFFAEERAKAKERQELAGGK